MNGAGGTSSQMGGFGRSQGGPMSGMPGRSDGFPQAGPGVNGYTPIQSSGGPPFGQLVNQQALAGHLMGNAQTGGPGYLPTLGGGWENPRGVTPGISDAPAATQGPAHRWTTANGGGWL